MKFHPLIHPWTATKSSKENPNENLYEWISGILGQVLNGYPLQCSADSHARGLETNGKTYKSEIWQGASFIHFRSSEFYSANLANWLCFNSHFSRTTPETSTFYNSPTNDIS